MKKLMKKYLSIIKSNQRIKDGFRYTVPSNTVYPHQWLWDSCFHAIIYSKLHRFQDAKDEIRSLLHGQWENGMVPHMIYWEKLDKHKVDWGTSGNTSTITQPPMIAYAVERIFQECGDKEFVFEVFGALDSYYKWLHKERSDDYVLSIIHPWESGEDDFVSWDNVYGIENPSKDDLKKQKINLLKQYKDLGCDSRKFMKKNIFNVKCLLFNCVYLRNLQSMRFLSGITGQKQNYYQDLVPKVKKSIKEHLYNKKIKLYSSTYNGNKFIHDFDNSSIFMPLFAGLLTKPQAQKLVDNFLLNNNLFWTKFPIPTQSLSNSNFKPNRYWRGSTWININWFVHKGLIDYGFSDIAKKLTEKTKTMVNKSGFCEYYNSLTGFGLGPKDFCWSGLIFDM